MSRAILGVVLFVLMQTQAIGNNKLGQFYADGRPIEIPEDIALHALSQIKKVAESLPDCDNLNTTFTNPLINKKQRYTITGGGEVCRVLIFRDERHSYTCYLSSIERAKLAKVMLSKVRKKDVFGDLTEAEQSLFFYSGKCNESRV